MHTDEGNEHDIEQQSGVKEKETAEHAAKKKTQAQNAKNMKIPPQERDGKCSKAPHSSGITANKERVYRKP